MHTEKAQKLHKIKKLKKNHHFIFIEVPLEIVAPQAILWGESTWWPMKCLSRFKRLTEGEIGEGTEYLMRIQKPLGPKMKLSITRFVPNKLVERTFQSGMFRGYEVVKIEERANGTRIDYELHYSVRGILNKILWVLCYQTQHDDSIKTILTALKDYAAAKYNEQFENPREPRKESI